MSDREQTRSERCCTRCGKSVEDESYQLWAFRTCRHCAMEADGRFRDGGTYRKWRYFPRWHMTRHPDLPAQKRERHAMTDGGQPSTDSEQLAGLPYLLVERHVGGGARAVGPVDALSAEGAVETHFHEFDDLDLEREIEVYPVGVTEDGRVECETLELGGVFDR